VKKHLITIVTAVIVLAMWQIIAMAVNMTHILPSPSSTLVRLWELRKSLFTVHLPATLETIVIASASRRVRTHFLLMWIIGTTPFAHNILHFCFFVNTKCSTIYIFVTFEPEIEILSWR